MSLVPPCVDWSDIDGVILDVDGTLFDLAALRRRMVMKLVHHLLFTGGVRDLRVVKAFREAREELARTAAIHIGSRQFEVVAERLNVSVSEVERVVTRWIYVEPLAYLTQCAPIGARDFVILLKLAGIKVGVFSDYPAADKLAALAISVETAFDAAMPSIGLLKPDPTGFLRTAEALGVVPDRCIVIGDRDDRDGVAARDGGFHFVQVVARAGRSSGYDALIKSLKRDRSQLL